MGLQSLHLILNHVPAAGTIIALLLLAWGLLRRQHRVASLALLALVVTGLLAIPVYVTGGAAGNEIGNGERANRHRESAVAALIGLEAAAATAAAALVAARPGKRFPVFQAAATLVIGLAALALLIRAATLGSEIRLGEMRAATTGAMSR